MAVTCRNFGMRPSAYLKIEDETVAYDFDRAASYRLVIFDAEQEKSRKKDEAQLVNLAMMAAQVGEPLEFNDDETDADILDIPTY